MSAYKTRNILTYFEDALGAEHDIGVDVWAVDVREVEMEELPPMPATEYEQLRQRLTDLYWAEESRAYEIGQCRAEDRAE